jgi:MinD-like ATPase involved in chromosome partitioning or flagellar assembly
MDESVAPQQNPYVLEPLVKPQGHTEPKNTTSKKGFSLFKKKTTQKTVPAQIITFWGAGNGVGNSQIAFNSAISLANKGYHVLYVDLNDKFSAVESMMQLGFEDLGIDTMLNNIEQGKNDKVGHAISSIAKILPFTDKRDFLYKTYTNMPSSLNFAFFSQHCFERRTGIKYNVELIRELNMMWLMDYGYDIIILDAPADATNRLTQLALAYANKVFITLSQDKTVLSRMLKQMKYLSMQRISVREKSFYIVNKFENNAFSYNNLQNFISMNLEYENLELLSIPNLSKEFTNSIYNGTPIILSTKNKELLKTISDIVTLIES